MSDLKQKRICRFCLTQKGQFADLFRESDQESNWQIKAIQVTSLEILNQDDLPKTICKVCQDVMSAFYQYKQSCKKAEILLKLYPVTKTIPDPIELPKDLIQIIQTFRESSLKYKSPEKSSDRSRKSQSDIELKKPKTEPVSPQDKHDKSKSSPPDKHKDNPEKRKSNPLPKKPESSSDKVKSEIRHKNEGSSSKHNDRTDKTSPKINNENSKKGEVPEKSIGKTSPEAVVRNKESSTNRTEPTASQKQEHIEKMDISVLASQKSVEKMDISIRESQNMEVDSEKSGETVVLNSKMLKVSPQPERKTLQVSDDEEEHFELAEIADDIEESSEDQNGVKNDTSSGSDHSPQATDGRKYKCCACEKAFTKSNLLMRHEQTVHKNLPKLECTICLKQFLNKDYYESHLMYHEKQKFLCRLCDKKFINKQTLEKHEVSAHGISFKKQTVENPQKVDALPCVTKNTQDNKRKISLESSQEVESKKSKVGPEVGVDPNNKEVMNVLNKLPKGLTVKKELSKVITQPNSAGNPGVRTVETPKSATNGKPQEATAMNPKLLNFNQKQALPTQSQPPRPAPQAKPTDNQPKILNSITIQPPKPTNLASVKSSVLPTPAKTLNEGFNPTKQSTPIEKSGTANNPRVKKIQMSRQEINKLIAEGKIEMKNGNMVLKS